MGSSVTKISCNIRKFFKYWLQFTTPLHKLQTKDIEILSYLLKKRYELSKFITDDNMIDSYLFSKDVRNQILEESGETRSNLQVGLSKLRKAGVLLEDNKINKKFIPALDKIKGDKFSFMVVFDIIDDAK